ncbi:hypothetical protein A2974_01985 [Candidatus Peregrinibacteria bacterium RIFCSPLOWO2_01_FULL_48_20]|nr:MAG: hypothetical protein A2974_01985 [Candidatus Peregrinibacteria bacterium RIFCSPLOWO2_01_FULL_48_20]
MDLYAEQIIDLSKNPLNRGALANASFTHSGVNTTCGDHVRLYVLVKGGKVKEAMWEGDGCAISIAAASVLTEEMRGKKVEDLGWIKKEDLFEWLGIDHLGPARVKCVTLCLETLQLGLTQEPNL